jgi:hypothetical protein
MAWLAVDKDGSEIIYTHKPKRAGTLNYWIALQSSAKLVDLPKGSIKRLIGRELTWDDEPVEFVEVVTNECSDNAYKYTYPIGVDITQGQFAPEYGLTKREIFAAMAMQGLLASSYGRLEGNVARLAVEYADALLAESEKTK